MPNCKQHFEQRTTPKKYQPQNYSLSSDSLHTKAPANQKPNEVTVQNHHPLQEKCSYHYFQHCLRNERHYQPYSVGFMKESDSRCEGVDRTTHMGLNMGKSVFDGAAFVLCRFLFVVFATFLLWPVSPQHKDSTMWETFYLFNLMHILFTCLSIYNEQPQFYLQLQTSEQICLAAQRWKVCTGLMLDKTVEIYEFPSMWN